MGPDIADFPALPLVDREFIEPVEVFVVPVHKRAPAQAQRSGLRGERRLSGVSEPCRLRRGEGYGA